MQLCELLTRSFETCVLYIHALWKRVSIVPLHIRRIRAVAGIGSACGLGASPAPDLREPARAAPTYTQIPPGCTPRLQWGSVVAWSSTAVTTGFVRGHRAPVTTNNRRTHRGTHHRCTRMCKRPNLPPVPRSSPASSKLQLRT
jgi:hypothetical protein